MTVSASAAPLAALLWVFAVVAVALTALAVAMLSLALRHRRRRRNEVYSRLLSASSSSQISRVLTISDLLTDARLREQIRQQVEQVQVSEGRNLPPYAIL